MRRGGGARPDAGDDNTTAAEGIGDEPDEAT